MLNCVGDLAGFELISSVYSAGDYVLTMTAIDVEEQTATVNINLTIVGMIDRCPLTLKSLSHLDMHSTLLRW